MPKITSEKNQSIFKEVLIVQDSTDTRLDVFIASKFPDIPRTLIQKHIKNGFITVNKKRIKPRYLIKKGDLVKIRIFQKTAPLCIEPQADLPISIIAKHDDFLIINKPSGISVHPSDHEHRNTVVNWALAHFPQITSVGEDPLRPGIVHRLDKDASGLLIIALKQKSFEFFKKQFKERTIRKKYHVFCWGTFKQKKGDISTFIGRSKARPTCQSTSARAEKLINPKNALTSFSVLKDNGKISLVEIELKTGRKHQIRIHLQSIGHPVVGDKLYFTKNTKQKNAPFSRLFLHASHLSFKYSNMKKYEFSCPIPLKFSKHLK
ncbi:MAG: RluA family pseudouridine synthase [Patescibacteria group bacterium]|nr:RluA family pseudouridine synthase [Patescibacteria group bacterium]